MLAGISVTKALDERWDKIGDIRSLSDGVLGPVEHKASVAARNGIINAVNPMTKRLTAAIAAVRRCVFPERLLWKPCGT